MGDAAATLIESLTTAAFPHAVTSIDVHETHISWVVLTGPFAYKIKKPVNLGFVDFTSLSRRRFFCEEELRLNRRLAPDLYLDVLPISGTERSPQIGGTGTPLEWCVRMRQFAQDRLLTRIVRRGLLESSHLDALALQIAEFHAKIPSAAPESPFGTPAAVAGPIRTTLNISIGSILPPNATSPGGYFNGARENCSGTKKSLRPERAETSSASAMGICIWET